MSGRIGKQKWTDLIASILVLVGFGYVLIRACFEFYEIAWGTGVWLGEFSLKWGMGFFAFVLLCVLSWATVIFILWKPNVLAGWGEGIKYYRKPA